MIATVSEIEQAQSDRSDSTPDAPAIEPKPEPPRPNPWFCSWPVAALFVAGLLKELLLASQSPSHAIWVGGLVSLTTVATLCWFWFTMAQLVGWMVPRFIPTGAPNARDSNRRRLGKATILAGCTTVLIIGYAISWGMHFQTGRFANIEAFRFAFSNWTMLQDYLRAANGWENLLAILVGVLALLAIPIYGRWVLNSHADEPTAITRRLLAWIGLTVLAVCLKDSVAADPSIQRRFANLDRLNACVNPAVSLWSSAQEAWRLEEIQPTLDTSRLTPLASPETTSTNNLSLPGRFPTKKNVIIVAVESLRPDMIDFQHQGQPVLPHINRLAKNSRVMTRAYAQSTHSDYADVCLVSSLYPLRSRQHHFYNADDPWPKTLIYDVLKPAGYATAIISSQNEAWGAMDQFLASENLDWFYHPQNSDAPTVSAADDPGFQRERAAGTLVAGKFPDQHTADVAIDWISDQVAAGSPFYLSMNLQSSHFPYLIPNDASRPFQPCELGSDIKFSSYPAAKIPVVRNAYYNGIHECDRQVGRLIERLKSLDVWEETILVVTGENGEAFHENHSIGHAGNPYEPVIHVAAVISAPGLISAGTDDYPMEHVDLVPTILGLMKRPTHPNFQGVDVFATNRTPAAKRMMFFHVISPIAKGDAVILGQRWKFITTREHVTGQLFDLKHDPDESTDLSAEYPQVRSVLKAAINTWRRGQLAYYHLPAYYTQYYPPAPPTYEEICARLNVELHEEVLTGVEVPIDELLSTAGRPATAKSHQRDD